MEFVPAKALAPFLPYECELFSVQDSTGQLVRKINRYELSIVISAGDVIKGVIRKRKLAYLLLMVSRQKLMRLLDHLQISASSGITKAKQDRGAKKWIHRLDRADGGRTGASTTLHVAFGERGSSSKLCKCASCKPDLHRNQEHAA